MSSNSGGSDVLTVIVLLFAGYWIFLTVVAAVIMVVTAAYYVALFIAFALSVLALSTLWCRIRIGRLSMGPRQSAPILARGMCGAVLVPGFGLFCHLFLNRPVPQHWWPHLFAVGWALGSVGVGLFEAVIIEALGLDEYQEDEDHGLVIEHDERPALPGPSSPRSGSGLPVPRSSATVPARPPLDPAWEAARNDNGAPNFCARFQFATWDDEEEMLARKAERGDDL